MALDWFKNISKEYPKFWMNYLAHFDVEKDSTVAKRYVVFDCETTGLDYQKDVILSVGAITIQDNKIKINDYLELYLLQDVYKNESAKIHGILKDGKEEKIVEAEAIIRFLDFIKDSVLVGHHINFDVEMINQALKRLDVGRLKNQIMDTDAMYQKLKGLQVEEHSSLDELCEKFKISKNARHTASGDAFITALVFLKIKSKLGI